VKVHSRRENNAAAVLLLMELDLSSCSQPHVTYGSNPKAGHYVHVNGIELYYEIYGKGHPLAAVGEKFDGVLTIF
jgi:hypothetical protein